MFSATRNKVTYLKGVGMGLSIAIGLSVLLDLAIPRMSLVVSGAITGIVLGLYIRDVYRTILTGVVAGVLGAVIYTVIYAVIVAIGAASRGYDPWLIFIAMFRSGVSLFSMFLNTVYLTLSIMMGGVVASMFIGE